MIREFPTEVIASVYTGLLLCDFGSMHECIEFLDGGPVFTHQLAYKAYADSLSAAVLLQHPGFEAVDSSGVTADNWKEFKRDVIEKMGSSLSLVPMGEFIEHRDESFTEPLKGKQVLCLEVPEE